MGFLYFIQNLITEFTLLFQEHKALSLQLQARFGSMVAIKDCPVFSTAMLSCPWTLFGLHLQLLNMMIQKHISKENLPMQLTLCLFNNG